MIRVLQVVTYMGRGGLETMLMNYYRNMDRDKVQFGFLVHRQERADYDDEIEALGGRIYCLPRLVPWSSHYKRELNRFFDKHPDYQIVHVHQDCLSSVILKAAKQHGVPVRIAHSHNANQDRNLKYPIKLWYRRSIPRYATNLFACGTQAGDWMFRGQPYTVVQNAIDPTVYTFSTEKREKVRAQLGLTDELVVGHVGRFFNQKNHMFLLEIFSEVIKHEPTAKLMLVGDGDDFLRVQERARELKLQNNVLFLGVRSDVADLMQAMDVFVFPSLYEGLPVTMVEAQAAGLPCVISDGVSPECILANDLVGVLSLSDGTDVWANRVIAQAGKVRKDCSGEVAAQGFDIRNEVEKLQNFYVNAYEEIK